MVKLEQRDFQNLVPILQGLPEFQTTRDRSLFLTAAGLDDHRILSRIDLEGSPSIVAGRVIRFLADFGRVSFDREALGVLLAYIREFVPDMEPQANILDSVIGQYELNVATSKVSAISQWRDRRGESTVKEIIIGENTLRPIADLEKALLAAKAVVHLLVGKRDGKKCYGTGFMVAPNLLMTNNHVIEIVQEATSTEYTFQYQVDIYGREMPTVTTKAVLNGIFFTNTQLDYTIVELTTDSLLEFTPLRMNIGSIFINQRVNIIQHPGGQPKKISMQNNHVAYSDNVLVQYYTSTQPGSSGSPVLNDNFEVVAIHHSGGLLEDPGTGRRFLRNAGTPMSAILSQLRKAAPDIYSCICRDTST